jgi:16S rRNA (uracil1498-N3)-methyltransferase
LLHERADEPLARAALPVTGELVIVVGPEGGIAEEELAEFAAAGAQAVRLGDPVLRTSTAGTAALAALSLRLGRWT